jgi:hypothetical protein
MTLMLQKPLAILLVLLSGATFSLAQDKISFLQPASTASTKRLEQSQGQRIAQRMSRSLFSPLKQPGNTKHPPTSESRRDKPSPVQPQSRNASSKSSPSKPKKTSNRSLVTTSNFGDVRSKGGRVASATVAFRTVIVLCFCTFLFGV